MKITRLNFLFIYQLNLKVHYFFVKIKKINFIIKKIKRNKILNLLLFRLNIKKAIIELFAIKLEKLYIILINFSNNEGELRFIYYK